MFFLFFSESFQKKIGEIFPWHCIAWKEMLRSIQMPLPAITCPIPRQKKSHAAALAALAVMTESFSREETNGYIQSQIASLLKDSFSVAHLKGKAFVSDLRI
jgi:hypothetical protein